jgi:tRNA1(Val) A37 N6-methylase TrmN6
MQQITIHATAEKLNSRIIAVFSKEKKDLLSSAFTIREINGKYTKEYITLTAAFHHTDLSA